MPEWLLRRFNIFGHSITLPNRAKVRYDRYTVPCCADCNSLMGEVVEQPISSVVQGGAQAINDFASAGNLLKLFVWMGLIYLKTHLKDRYHRFHLDERKGIDKIADDYDWEHLHHIHSVVRCFYNDCVVDREAIGSFLSVPVRTPETDDRFDFADLYMAQTMLLRLDDVAMVSVFNDSGAALRYFWQTLEKITGPLSSLRLRELMVHLAYLNLHLKRRPVFHTECDIINETCHIVATVPELDLQKLDRKTRGALLYEAVRDVLPKINFPGRTSEEVVVAIKSGTLTFLFDDEGNFIAKPWSPRPKKR